MLITAPLTRNYPIVRTTDMFDTCRESICQFLSEVFNRNLFLDCITSSEIARLMSMTPKWHSIANRMTINTLRRVSENDTHFRQIDPIPVDRVNPVQTRSHIAMDVPDRDTHSAIDTMSDRWHSKSHRA